MTPLFFLALALAQDSSLELTQTPLRLTLREAIEIGLRPGHRADVALAAEAVRRAESNTRAGRAALYPTVEATVSGGERKQNLGAQGFGGGNLPISLTPNFTQFDARPTISATLLNFSQLKNFKAVRREATRTLHEQDSALDNAALAIARQYAACLDAQAARHAAGAEVKLSRELLEAAESRLQAGTVTKVDVTRAKAQLAADQSALLAARQSEREALASLFRGIGAEYFEDVELVALPAAAATHAPVSSISQTSALESRLSTAAYLAASIPATLEAALAAATANRADLRIREQSIRAAEDKLKAAQWEKLPMLTASFDYGRNGTAPTDTAWTRNATAALKVTLLDFGRRKEKEVQAGIALREERIRLLDLRREIQREVRVALGRLESADAQLAAAKAEMELSDQQIEQVRERMTVGLAAGLDSADAQTRRARSVRSLLNAENSLLNARIEIWHATGQLRQMIENIP